VLSDVTRSEIFKIFDAQGISVSDDKSFFTVFNLFSYSSDVNTNNINDNVMINRK